VRKRPIDKYLSCRQPLELGSESDQFECLSGSKNDLDTKVFQEDILLSCRQPLELEVSLTSLNVSADLRMISIQKCFKRTSSFVSQHRACFSTSGPNFDVVCIYAVRTYGLMLITYQPHHGMLLRGQAGPGA
jgi:hypothetical protein